MKHYPAREDNTPGAPKRFTALCGYTSANKKEFTRPEKAGQVTCEKCRARIENRNRDEWGNAARVDEP